jgi:XTP/dITP diphosphohydrolase
VEQRTARFRCVAAVAVPGGWVYTADGACEGVIAGEPRGDGGFGYDPLFYLPEYGKTFAELDLETKNKISHRGKAMAGALDILSELKNVEGEE